jgi:hypothetical protein
MLFTQFLQSTDGFFQQYSASNKFQVFAEIYNRKLLPPETKFTYKSWFISQKQFGLIE